MKIVCLVALLLASMVGTAMAQQEDLQHAVALFDQGEHRQALPLFQKLAQDGSKAPIVYERLGFLLLEMSGAPKEADARRRQRAEARRMFEKALQLGSRDLQVRALHDGMPEDGGGDADFSKNPAVQEAMRVAEAAYSARDFGAAFAAYQKALTLDPTLYEAAVFSGDTYLHRAPLDSAYVWYARATQIDPDRELAWRYWSDVLLKHDRRDEAKERAIRAIIAEPHQRMGFQAISSWAQVTHRSPEWPPAFDPADNATRGTAARTAYDSVRAAWRGADGRGGPVFRQAYPGDSVYRHSLQEEVAALRAAAKVTTTETGVLVLRDLDSAELLEAFILFRRVDAGIAQDYDAYRREHREQLFRLWNRLALPDGTTLR